jgi:TolB-like protein
MKTFVQELKNRRVYRVAIAYLVGGSAVVQVAGTILPTFHAPEWIQQVFVALVAICFPIALVLAWSFDLREGTIEKTPATPGSTSFAHKRQLWVLIAISSFVAAAGLAGYWFWHPWRTIPAKERPSVAAILEKSIAVLPFENLSDDKDAGYFTEGVQDEILMHLSRVADLKVISRTSVMQYRSGATRNLRAIAAELGVAHIVEGTVQRSKGRVRINAQLIDARTDAHLWGERYDRELADIFAIQTEVAEKIVSQLKARLSPDEKAAIEERPTHDLTAYDLYLRAKTLIDTISFVRARENLFEAAQLLQEAVERDPAFLRAHYQLARAHDQIYFLGIDHTPARLALADAAVKATLRLRPGAGEPHLALAQHL